MKRRQYHDGDIVRIKHALVGLRGALHHLKLAGARKTAARVRLAISSCKGAVRNAYQLRGRAERGE